MNNSGVLEALAQYDQVGVALSASTPTLSTVTNTGSILAAGIGGQGVHLSFGGVVANSGAEALISGSGAGVVLYGGASLAPVGTTVSGGYSTAPQTATVSNSGTIVGKVGVLGGATHGAGTVSGTYSYVRLTTKPGVPFPVPVEVTVTKTGTVTEFAPSLAVVQNTGTILGSGTGGQGIVLEGPASLQNSGLVSGPGGALVATGTFTGTNSAAGALIATGSFASAVLLEGTASLVNDGVILSQAMGGLGVVLDASATLSDAGVVNAGVAGVYGLTTSDAGNAAGSPPVSQAAAAHVPAR